MWHVGGYKFKKANSFWPKRLALTCSFVIYILSVGCSQSVDSVSITGGSPTVSSFDFIFHSNLEGTTNTIPTATSFQLGIHSFGGSSLRTQSSSASFNLTSGIGVD